MNRKVIRIIISLTSISLVAAIITQLLWVRDAWQLKEDQFNTKIDIALKSVVNHLMTSENYYPTDPELFNDPFFLDHSQILNELNPVILDSLIKSEFTDMQLNDKYQYGVFRQSDQLLIMGNYTDFEDEILSSEHWVSLSCLCQDQTYILATYFPQEQSMILNSMIILPVMSGLFLMVLVFSFFFTIYSLLRQKKLSEMKTDFVNNMTHEFKTPISTISVSSEMLTKEKVFNDKEKIQKYARIIFDENARLKNQVEGVLQIAAIEKGDYKLKMKETDVHQVIQECIHNFRVQVQDRRGELKTILTATNHVVNLDKVHFSNVINNLLDNANKYSPEKPEIEISTLNENNSIFISVADKGIGISRENISEVFKKFHRLQSGDIHDVKGFGIGLFYVKTMVEEMGGQIDLKSEPGKGSIFSLRFPV